MTANPKDPMTNDEDNIVNGTVAETAAVPIFERRSLCRPEEEEWEARFHGDL